MTRLISIMKGNDFRPAILSGDGLKSDTVSVYGLLIQYLQEQYGLERLSWDVIYPHMDCYVYRRLKEPEKYDDLQGRKPLLSIADLAQAGWEDIAKRINSAQRSELENCDHRYRFLDCWNACKLPKFESAPPSLREIWSELDDDLFAEVCDFKGLLPISTLSGLYKKRWSQFIYAKRLKNDPVLQRQLLEALDRAGVPRPEEAPPKPGPDVWSKLEAREANADPQQEQAQTQAFADSDIPLNPKT